MADTLNPDEEVLLQSALATAFSPAPLPRQSVHLEPPAPPQHAPENPPPSSTTPESAPSAEPESAEAVWKTEYDAHVEDWRQRSAEQRQKAEEERARWEALRAKEQQEGKLSESISAYSMSGSGWESVGPAARGGSPSPADVRDLVAGEAQGEPREDPCTSTPPDTHERTSSEPESTKHDRWEDIPSSLASSYPSLSFPSDPHSPSSGRPTAREVPLHAHNRAPTQPHPSAPAAALAPGSATLSVFDRALSPRTRALALLSSVAINVLLPFVNGVMLGFGEIFAKNVVVGWFGWKPAGPGALSASVGLGAPKRKSK
ncbi:hypothetical protein B0H21DRAFT_137944 [Amylocystis lapponica]|nr:hypothetical protein B0H21DRAFT_137944 [Amylocystis lapponica]